jgi:hypothetical protein
MFSLRASLSFLLILLSGRLASGAGVEKVPANPQKGFSWAYYLSTPNSYKNPVTLVVEPTDSPLGSDDLVYHETLARTYAVAQGFWAEDIGSPLIVPAIPRTTFGVDLGQFDVNPQMLARELFLNKVPGLERLDLQVIAMIDDAREKLAARGVTVDKKVFMWGASSQATFINRFTLMHPDRVKAASFGSTSFFALPVAAWKGSTLNYPWGVADLQSIVGQPFDSATFQKVPLQIFEGDADRNWAQIRGTSNNPQEALLDSLFGGPETFRRMPGFESVFKSVQSSCQFIVFPGMGHDWPDWSYLKEFFERNRTEPPPAPLPKPMLFKLYFPHVASSGPWQTEVALTNTTPVSIQGQLRAFKADGTGPTEAIDISLAPSSRKEINVGKAFQKPQDIAYLVLTSDSGFVGGYTRFNQPGNRVSLPISGATKQGLFPKIEKNGGWTGLAFVNTEGAQAIVTLMAYDDNGGIIGAEQITVNPGAKVLGMAEQVFHSDLTRARYVTFSSTRLVVAFSVSGSPDGLALDGITALREYALK